MSAVVLQRPLDGLEGVDNTMQQSTSRYLEHSDSRSSSLSELDDGLEEHDALLERRQTSDAEDDTEAETERLENTPQKLRATADLIEGTANGILKTPSGLKREIDINDVDSEDVDDENVDPGSPSARIGGHANFEQGIPGSYEHLDRSHITPKLYFGNNAGGGGRKRKRASPGSSSGSDELGCQDPLRKRSGSAKDGLYSGTQAADGNKYADDAADHYVHDFEGAASPLEEQDRGFEEDEAAEQVLEEQTVSMKASKPKKGKGKGKKAKNGETSDKVRASLVQSVAPEGDGVMEVEGEDDEAGAVGEESAKKKSAVGSLSNIEMQFSTFREQHIKEQIAQLSFELDLLRQPQCVHPEYLAMIRCVDGHRDKQIHIETQKYKYKMESLETKVVAERQQLHSQYFQIVREIREKAIDTCWEQFYALQRDRRRCGADELDYVYKYLPKRSQQIQQQRAYNLEVSILSGIAKYVGFPAAPEIKGLRNGELDDDLRAMRIPQRPAPFAPRAFVEPSRADRTAAEEQFFEQTPWANPQHPAHSHVNFHPSRITGGLFATPAAQKRAVDVHVPNGSASTIEMVSNPPSSAAAPGSGLPDHMPQRDVFDSPVPQPNRIGSIGGPSHLSDAAERIQTHQFVNHPIPSLPHDSNILSQNIQPPEAHQEPPSARTYSNPIDAITRHTASDLASAQVQESRAPIASLTPVERTTSIQQHQHVPFAAPVAVSMAVFER